MKELQVLAFKKPMDILQQEKISYLYWPESWVSAVKNKESYKLKRKLESLTEKLIGFFPEIVFIQNNLQSLSGNQPWIIARIELPAEKVKYIYDNWMATINEHDSKKFEADIDFHWETGLAGELLEKQNENSKFLWIPALITHLFCESKTEMVMPNAYSGTLAFSPVRFGKTFEAMSDPIKSKEKNDYFSFVYRFELITRGIENELLLKVSIGIRRYYQGWERKSLPWLRNNQKVTVLVSIKNPFIEKDIQSFSKFKIERKNSSVQWANGYNGLFNDVMFGKTLDLHKILKDPTAHIENTDPKVLIVYNESTFQGKGTSVEKGIGLPEREALLAAFIKKFPTLELITPAKEIAHRFSNGRFPLIAPPGVEEITLEIFSETEELKALLKKVLLDKAIATNQIEENKYLLNSETPVVMNIVSRQPENIVRDLDIEKYGQKAALKHTQTIIQKLTPSIFNENSLALIEIDSYEGYEDKDPKQAIREGLAKTKRISQFIHPVHHGNTEHRLNKSLLDLLADKGFRKQNWTKFSTDGITMALSIVKTKNGSTSHLPVISKMEHKQVLYRVYGNKEWLSLEEILVAIHKQKQYLSFPNKGNDASMKLKNFLVDSLLEVLNKTNKKVYFIVDAVLRSRWIPDLKNGDLDLDVIPEIDNVLSSYANLRIIRINRTIDVPQYFINYKDSVINKASGIFKDEKEIYYSVGGRPDTMKGLANGAVKFHSPGKLIAKQQAVEIIVLGAEKEERDQIVCMIDDLRRMVLTWDTHVQLPYPMHMVRSITKYLPQERYTVEEELEDEIVMEEDGQLAIAFNTKE